MPMQEAHAEQTHRVIQAIGVTTGSRDRTTHRPPGNRTSDPIPIRGSELEPERNRASTPSRSREAIRHLTRSRSLRRNQDRTTGPTSPRPLLRRPPGAMRRHAMSPHHSDTEDIRTHRHLPIRRDSRTPVPITPTTAWSSIPTPDSRAATTHSSRDPGRRKVRSPEAETGRDLPRKISSAAAPTVRGSRAM